MSTGSLASSGQGGSGGIRQLLLLPERIRYRRISVRPRLSRMSRCWTKPRGEIPNGSAQTVGICSFARRLLVKTADELQIVALSAHPDLASLVAAWRVGAFGYPGGWAVEELSALLLAPSVGPEETFI